MNAPLKLAAFLVLLAAVFGVSFLTGTQSTALLAPIPAHNEHSSSVGGLQSSLDGYTLKLSNATVKQGKEVPVEIVVSGPDGQPVSAYDTVNDAQLHLIVVRRDLTGYQHVYPRRDPAGSWQANLDLTAGPWRILVDFQPTALGRELTLATDLTVRGTYEPQPLSAKSVTTDVDGYSVGLTGELSTTEASQLTFNIQRGGQPVTDLETYHASLGHAVIIRPADFGYIHLHPDSSSGASGPNLSFSGSVPDRGVYRVFVEFHTSSIQHVAVFTVEATR